MVRYVCCEFYNKCLDEAVKNSRVFNCFKCKQFMHADIPSYEIEAAIILMWAIFRPERYSDLRDIERYGKVRRGKNQTSLKGQKICRTS